jgi:hypothetical protein
MPKKIRAAAVTDDLGNATLKSGKVTLPIQLRDEDTGSPIAGLAVALAQDKKNKGRAILVVADGLERYPLQVTILHGPVTSHLALAPKPLASSVPSSPSPVVVSTHSASDSVVTGVIKTLQTGLLPSFVESANDNKNLPPVILTVLKALSSSKDLILPPPLRGVLPSKTSSQPVSADQMNDVVMGRVTDASIEAAFAGFFFSPLVGLEEGLQHAAFHLVPELLNMGAANLYQMLGCNDLSLSEISFGGIVFEMVTPATTGCQPVDIPKGVLQITATDTNGQPISGGSLEAVSDTNLGLGFLADISNGEANLSVPQDDYDWCLRSPGFKPQCGQVSVTDSGATIDAVMEPQPIASGIIIQDRLAGYGFLPEGTQFTVTPRFFDINGTEVDCDGPVKYYAHNPVGTLVATVDSDTGLVTMQGGCGAAGITAWCNGMESRRLLVSTDCHGKLPPNPHCAYSIFPTAGSFTASGGDGSVTVAASDDTCTWTATSHAGWITITSGDSGSGNETVGYSVEENSGTSKRVGKITIAGKTFTVTQAGTPASSTTFDGEYEGTVTTVTPLGTTVGQGTFFVTGGFVYDPGFTFIGTVDSSGNFTGTTTVCVGCDPMVMTGTFSLTGNFTISGASGSVSQTVVAHKTS